MGEIPGGYVEQGELAAAIREVREELGSALEVGELLVLDWTPHPSEGDKLLVIFNGRTLTHDDLQTLMGVHQSVFARLVSEPPSG